MNSSARVQQLKAEWEAKKQEEKQKATRMTVKFKICEYPETCGGPWGDPGCVPCFEYALEHVWP